LVAEFARVMALGYARFLDFQQVARPGSAEKEGTGLGLAIAQKSVEILGGTLAAESEVGQGTTFTLRIRDYQSK